MTTERPASVRIATPKDEDEVMRLMRRAFDEQPIFALNEQRMRANIRMCTERRGGILGVIDGPNGIEGYLIAMLGQHWYSDEWHLEELSNFVDPDYRKSTHAKDLINFVKWFAEQLKMPVILGILSTKRLEAKIRLYERQVRKVGAVFVFNTGHPGDALSEMG